MLSYNLDFSSCACKPGFVKSSHIYSKTFKGAVRKENEQLIFVGEISLN